MKLIITLYIILHALTAYSQEQLKQLLVKWRSKIVDSGYLPISVLLASSVDESTWMIVNSASLDDNYNYNKWAIHKISNNGNRELFKAFYKHYEGGIGSNTIQQLTDIGEIAAFCETKHGDILLVGLSNNYRPQLMKMSKDGILLTTKDIESEIYNIASRSNSNTSVQIEFSGSKDKDAANNLPSKIRIVGIMPFDEYSYLLFGGEEEHAKGETSHIADSWIRPNENGWVMAVDNEGDKVWAHTFDYGKSEWVTSMARTDDKAFVFALNSGTGYTMYEVSDESDVILIKCNADGQVMAKKQFQGRNAKIVTLRGDKLGMIYDRRHDISKDIWFVVLDNNMDIVSEDALYRHEGSYNCPALYLLSVQMDVSSHLLYGVIVAGLVPVDIRIHEEVAKFDLRIWHYDQNGKRQAYLNYNPGFPNDQPVKVDVRNGSAIFAWISSYIDDEYDKPVVSIMGTSDR